MKFKIDSLTHLNGDNYQVNYTETSGNDKEEKSEVLSLSGLKRWLDSATDRQSVNIIKLYKLAESEIEKAEEARLAAEKKAAEEAARAAAEARQKEAAARKAATEKALKS